MKNRIGIVSAAVLAAAAMAAPAQAQNSASFTYQGKLKVAGAPVNGEADFEFRLYDSTTGGNQIGSTITYSGVNVTDGVFTRTLNFGSDAYNGANRYLEIAVRSPSGVGNFVILTPRQQLTAAPHAWFAARPWIVNGTTLSYSGGTVNVGPGGLTGSSAPSMVVTRDWNNEHGALTLMGDRPTLRFWGGAAAGNHSWIAHLGNGGGLGFFRRTGNSTWQDVLTMQTNGNVGIGTPNPTSKLEVVGQDAIAVTGFQPYITLRDTGANNARVLLSTGNGNFGLYTNDAIAAGIPDILVKNASGYAGFGDADPQFRIELPNFNNADGQIRANAHVTYSSERWKENVQTIEGALDIVKRLRGVTFDWKAEHGGSNDIGFVAEEVGEVVPQLVRWEEDGQWAQGLAYDRITAITVEAIKEQQAQIDALRAENEALRGQMAELIRLASERTN